MIARWLRILIALEIVAALAAAAAIVQFGGSVWTAILAAIAVPPSLHGCSIGLGSLAGAWHRRHAGLPAGLALAAGRSGRGLAWRTWAAEIVASLRTLGWLMPWRGERPLPTGSDFRRLPVVLVHGYFCNRAIWYPLARVLAARGHPVAAPNLEPPFGDLDGFEAQLEREVVALRALTGAERVVLVGHSLGGIVIRHWLRRRGSQRVARIVTLGSPHAGTWGARFGIGPAARRLEPGGEWLRELARSEPPWLRERFEVLLSLHDNIVMPQALQTLDGARNLAFSGLGHVELALDAAVWREVLNAIDRAAQREASGTRRADVA